MLAMVIHERFLSKKFQKFVDLTLQKHIFSHLFLTLSKSLVFQYYQITLFQQNFIFISVEGS